MASSILLLTDNQDKRKNIETICKSLNINFQQIRPGNINSPIGGFLGMPLNAAPKKQAPPMYTPPELLLFNGLSSQKLDVFIAKYNEAGIEPIALKGVINLNNITWSPYEFILEYEKEQSK